MLEAMDAASVDMAVACSLGQMIDNEFIAETARAHHDRIIGFGQANPRTVDARDQIRWCAEAGLRGIKLHPTMHGYHFADHGLLDPIFALCAELGLVVLVNALDDPFCAPLSIEEISRNFAEVPVLISHMGTVWNLVEAILVSERNENIYLETSCALLLDVRTAYRRLGARKIILGTDWPANDFDLERAKVQRAISDRENLALVEGGNLKCILTLGPTASQR